MAIYVGANNGIREAVAVYVGVNGAVKEVSAIYTGHTSYPGGNPAYETKTVYENGPEPGQRVFTESGNFTVPDKCKKIQVFLVGGGGHGNTDNKVESLSDRGITSGAGGGYTTTGVLNVSPGDVVTVAIGAGGRFYNGGDSICSALTAAGGTSSTMIGLHDYGLNQSKSIGGGSGGSGGGGSWDPVYLQNEGGSDGSNGGGWSSNGYSSETGTIMGPFLGGPGQGSTTRAFGESDGTLYAGGGGGGHNGSSLFNAGGGGAGGGGNGGGPSFAATAGATNTGGGGGGFLRTDGTNKVYGKDGGSGIVIIRWGKW